MMKTVQKPSEIVEVPVELWNIMKTWPDAMNRCKTASAGLLFTLKEMEDILRAEELMLKVKKSE
jgi:hypothetical protein